MREQRAACFSDVFVRDRAGIERQLSRATEDFYRECLFIARREGLESVEKFDRLLAHTFKLADLTLWSNDAER
jgi:hypothetical protein